VNQKLYSYIPRIFITLGQTLAVWWTRKCPLQWTIIEHCDDRYTDPSWVGCYIFWYSKKGTGTSFSCQFHVESIEFILLVNLPCSAGNRTTVSSLPVTGVLSLAPPYWCHSFPNCKTCTHWVLYSTLYGISLHVVADVPCRGLFCNNLGVSFIWFSLL